MNKKYWIFAVIAIVAIVGIIFAGSAINQQASIAKLSFQDKQLLSDQTKANGGLAASADNQKGFSRKWTLVRERLTINGVDGYYCWMNKKDQWVELGAC